MTTHATQFVTPLTFHTLSGHPVITDLFPPNPADPLEHIRVVQGEEEKDAADLVVVARPRRTSSGNMPGGSQTIF